MARILLIEDEEKTAYFIKKGLEENCHSVELTNDGDAALHLAIKESFDVIISDNVLSGKDGRAICKELRDRKHEVPILMLSAMSNTDGRDEGFDFTADDYLVKPFEFRELIGRIESLLAKTTQPTTSKKLLAGDLILEKDLCRVFREGREIPLTGKESALLEYMIKHKGEVVTRSELAKHVWNIDFDTGTNMIEVYVNYLRNKIDEGFENKLIRTQFGLGYILEES